MFEGGIKTQQWPHLHRASLSCIEQKEARRKARLCQPPELWSIPTTQHSSAAVCLTSRLQWCVARWDWRVDLHWSTGEKKGLISRLKTLHMEGEACQCKRRNDPLCKIIQIHYKWRKLKIRDAPINYFPSIKPISASLIGLTSKGQTYAFFFDWGSSYETNWFFYMVINNDIAWKCQFENASFATDNHMTKGKA